MDNCLGAILETDQRVVFPLRQMLADSLNPQPRVLLIGDAGHVLHPLAGLGANLGFEDVRALLTVLRHLPAGGDPGAVGLWQVFARQRRARARLLIGLMATVQRLYAGTDPWQQLLRNTGVGWLNRLGPVKRQIIMEAMGLGPVATQGATGAGG
jgi:2-octaprenylphenol hydroxylase